MQDRFANYLQSQTELSEQEILRVAELATEKTLRRNEDFLRAGQVSRHKVFVVSGLLRTYGFSPDGNEHILQFSPENTWTLDVESYDKQIPSMLSIGAIEPSNILCWQKKDFNVLLETIPLFKRFADQLIARSTWYNRQRILLSLSGTPEEKYAAFVRDFPGYLARLPLRMIAAYLGISIKTLTRLRHAQRKGS